MKKLIIVLITLLFLVSGVSLADKPPKAYRDIRFGESEEEVEEKIEEDDKIKENFWDLDSGMEGFGVEVVDDHYDLSFYYYEDQLYRLEFLGRGETADYFDTIVKGRRDKLAEVINGAYGEPNFNKEIAFNDIQSGYVTWTHRWELVDKKIKIGIGKYEAEYYPFMLIEYLPLLEEKEEVEEKESEDF